MTFSKTPPTETGWHYFASNKVDQFTPVEVYSDFFGSLRSRGRDTRGGLWGGRVPAPGTTWTVEQIKAWLKTTGLMDDELHLDICLDNPKSGIATTTERNRKEDGHGQ